MSLSTDGLTVLTYKPATIRAGTVPVTSDDEGTHTKLDTQILVAVASCTATWITLGIVIYNSFLRKGGPRT